MPELKALVASLRYRDGRKIKTFVLPTLKERQVPSDMQAVSTRLTGPALKVSTAGLVAVAVIHVMIFFFFLNRTAIVTPFSDMFDYIAAYLQFREGMRSTINYFWLPHGEHRLMWTRLLTLVDVELFHTSGIAFIVAATGFLSGTAGLLWHQLRLALDEAGGDQVLALLAPMLVLTTANAVDCSVPINTTYPTTLFFVVLALVLFVGAERFRAHVNFGRAAAIVAALAAGLATGAGLLVWPILVWSAWQGRLRSRWMVFLIAAGTIFYALYLHNLPIYGLAPAVKMGAASFFRFDHLLKLAHYFLSFLGLPFSRAPSLDVLGTTIGAILLIAGLSAILWSVLSSAANSPSDRIGIGLILFGLGSAALATVSRPDLLGDARLPVRYTIFVTAIHVGILFLVLPRVASRLSEPGHRVSLSIACIIFAAMLLVQQIVVGRAAEQIAQSISAEAVCFVEGVGGTEIRATISPRPESARKVLATLRRDGLLAAGSARCNKDQIISPADN